MLSISWIKNRSDLKICVLRDMILTFLSPWLDINTTLLLLPSMFEIFWNYNYGITKKLHFWSIYMHTQSKLGNWYVWFMDPLVFQFHVDSKYLAPSSLHVKVEVLCCGWDTWKVLLMAMSFLLEKPNKTITCTTKQPKFPFTLEENKIIIIITIIQATWS